MGKLFGTDGVRGLAGNELTEQLAFSLGAAGATVLTQEGHKPCVLILHDGRKSAQMLQDALVEGLTSRGADVVLAGMLPTPGAAALMRPMGCNAAAVISASHNPWEYNGIKFFSQLGYKLSDELEDAIEEGVFNPPPEAPQKGKVSTIHSAADRYLDILLSYSTVDLQGKKIVIDCANGATSQIAPRLFKALGAQVTVLFASPNGTNINDGCGSTHPETLIAEVLRSGADAGLAFDGDGDRMLAVDEKGNLIDGDGIILGCARRMKQEGLLHGNTVVATVMSNMGAEKALEEMGITMKRAAVGDRYVLAQLLEGGYALGGEQSGHLIFPHILPTGDGMLSALRLFWATEGLSMGQATAFTSYPQVLINVRLGQGKRQAYLDDMEMAMQIQKAHDGFGQQGRVLVRPSGTEPLVRVMVEGKDEAMVNEVAQALAALIAEKFA